MAARDGLPRRIGAAAHPTLDRHLAKRARFEGAPEEEAERRAARRKRALQARTHGSRLLRQTVLPPSIPHALATARRQGSVSREARTALRRLCLSSVGAEEVSAHCGAAGLTFSANGSLLCSTSPPDPDSTFSELNVRAVDQWERCGSGPGQDPPEVLLGCCVEGRISRLRLDPSDQGLCAVARAGAAPGACVYDMETVDEDSPEPAQALWADRRRGAGASAILDITYVQGPEGRSHLAGCLETGWVCVWDVRQGEVPVLTFGEVKGSRTTFAAPAAATAAPPRWQRPSAAELAATRGNFIPAARQHTVQDSGQALQPSCVCASGPQRVLVGRYGGAVELHDMRAPRGALLAADAASAPLHPALRSAANGKKLSGLLPPPSRCPGAHMAGVCDMIPSPCSPTGALCLLRSGALVELELGTGEAVRLCVQPGLPAARKGMLSYSAAFGTVALPWAPALPREEELPDSPGGADLIAPVLQDVRTALVEWPAHPFVCWQDAEGGALQALQSLPHARHQLPPPPQVRTVGLPEPGMGLPAHSVAVHPHGHSFAAGSFNTLVRISRLPLGPGRATARALSPQ
eukprot:TRINITY_DN14526_c0_g1_i1.p1 TRINITY_DN14526_c0_g1~~TRINITY_DN14526_c0_g1_i1.p1  ORF type:complete len:577 (+),score=159.34 TRINITY_DN14526_c0_g1_i1:83-1813(+)